MMSYEIYGRIKELKKKTLETQNYKENEKRESLIGLIIIIIQDKSESNAYNI